MGLIQYIKNKKQNKRLYNEYASEPSDHPCDNCGYGYYNDYNSDLEGALGYNPCEDC